MKYMKEDKISILEVSQLEINGIYKTSTNNLIKILLLNKDTGELRLYDMTNLCTVYTTLEKHRLVKRIR